MQRIIYKDAQGNVCIVVPAPNAGMSVSEIAKKDVPSGLDYVIVDESAIPADRVFRNAWTGDLKNGRIDVDMAKARDVQRNAIRAARAAAFPALDIESTRATESGDQSKLASVVAAKQKLRDAPADPRIDAAKNTDDLRKVWPSELGPNPMERRA